MGCGHVGCDCMGCGHARGVTVWSVAMQWRCNHVGCGHVWGVVIERRGVVT